MDRRLHFASHRGFELNHAIAHGVNKKGPADEIGPFAM